MLPSNQGDIRYVTLWIPLILGVKVLHSICNMSTRGLPDMHTLGPAAPAPQGAHIRQTTCAHVTNTKYIPTYSNTTNTITQD